MKLASLTAATFFGLSATSVHAVEYTVKRTLQVSAQPTEVWNLIGDFCDIDDWHPAFSDCQLKVVDGRLHRFLTTPDDEQFEERRIAVEAGLSYTYKLANSPLPIENYTATLAVEPLNGTRIRWSAKFSSDDPTMEAKVAEMFEAGLSEIAKGF